MGKGKKREADFQKVKNKVGKKLKPATNATRTDFKSRSIHVTLQSQPAAGEAVSQRGQTLKDLLTKLSHPNNAIRKETLVGLKNYFEVNPDQLTQATSLVHVFEKVSTSIHDSSSGVRKALLAFLKFLFSNSSSLKIDPFITLFVVHIASAMTQLDGDIRADSVDFIDLFVSTCPQSFTKHGQAIFSNMFQLIGESKVDLCSGKLLSSITTFDGRLIDNKLRLKVLRTMHTYMQASLSSAGGPMPAQGSTGEIVHMWTAGEPAACVLPRIATSSAGHR